MSSTTPNKDSKTSTLGENADDVAALKTRVEALEKAFEDAPWRIQQAARERGPNAAEPRAQRAPVIQNRDRPASGIPQLQLQSFSDMKEAADSEERQPVAPADDDIEDVESHQIAWVTKIFSALHARIRNEPIVAEDSVDECKRKWSSHDKWLSELLDEHKLLTEKDIERKAWSILHEVLDLQENGLRKSSKFGATQMGNMKQHRLHLRAEPLMHVRTMRTSARLEQLIRYLSTCACIAYEALDQDHPHDIVANPAGVLLTKNSYKTSNDNRKEKQNRNRNRASSTAQASSSQIGQKHLGEEVTPTNSGARRRSALNAALSDHDDSPLKRVVTVPSQYGPDAYRDYLLPVSNSAYSPYISSALVSNPYAIPAQSDRPTYWAPGLNGGTGGDTIARPEAEGRSSDNPITLDVDEEEPGVMKVESDD